MNATLVRAAALAPLHSPSRVVLLAATVVWPIIVSLLSGSPGHWRDHLGYWVVLLVGATAISADRNSGALQVILARPVRRDSYVISHWLGIALTSFALTSAQVVLGIAAERATGVTHAVDLPALARCLVDVSVAVAATAALLVLMGSISGRSPAWAAHCVMSGLTLLTVGVLCDVSGRWVPIRDAFHASLVPGLNIAEIFQGTSPSWQGLSAGIATLVASLALAIVALNCHELSYADSATGAS